MAGWMKPWRSCAGSSTRIRRSATMWRSSGGTSRSSAPEAGFIVVGAGCGHRCRPIGLARRRRGAAGIRDPCSEPHPRPDASGRDLRRRRARSDAVQRAGTARRSHIAAGSAAAARFIAEDLVAREPWERANIERFRRALVLMGEADPDAPIAERLSGQTPFTGTDLSLGSDELPLFRNAGGCGSGHSAALRPLTVPESAAPRAGIRLDNPHVSPARS